MKSGTTKILLPLSVDNGFLNAAKFAFNFCKQSEGSIRVLIIDDDSPWHETTLLPFHLKQLVSTAAKSEQSTIAANNEQLLALHSLAKEMDTTFQEVIMNGHTATEILLQSRFHDVVIMSDDPVFADKKGTGPRRVNPVIEVLDQAITPIILCGSEAASTPGSCALYFDGGPSASVTLHQAAMMFQSTPETPIKVRVTAFDKPTAKSLAADAANFLRDKGMENIEEETSDALPIDFARSHSNDGIGIVILGIRSRQAYHDFRIGILAQHFIENEPGKIKVFC